jgi:hypothetical protein
VPAVVGTAKNGSVRWRGSAYSHSPLSLAGWHWLAWLNRIALAQSMGEPPPTAITASGLNCCTRLTPSSTSSKLGSGTMSLNTSTVTPAAVSKWIKGLAMPSFINGPSVISITRLNPKPSSSRLIDSEASGPTKLIGLGKLSSGVTMRNTRIMKRL